MARIGSGGDVSITIQALNQARAGINGAIADLKGFEKTSSSISEQMQAKADKASMAWVAMASKIAVAVYAVKKAYNVLEMAVGLDIAAAQFQQAERAFDNLALAHGVASGSMIENLRAVSAETISTANLMQSAGNAMTLGIPAAELEKMMEVARASSRITGQSVQKSFDDIAMGVGRQSKMILDNLGIVVDLDKAYRDYGASIDKSVSQLSELDKKQAFLNAVMDKGGQIVRDIGIEGLTAAEKFERFKAKFADTAIILGMKFIPLAEKALDLIDRIMGGPPETNDALSRLGEMRYRLEDFYKIQLDLLEQVRVEQEKSYGPLALFGGRDEVFLFKARENLVKIAGEIAKTEGEVKRLEEALIKAFTPKTAPTTIEANRLAEEQLIQLADATQRLGASKSELMAIDALAFINAGANNEQLARYNQLLLEQLEKERELALAKDDAAKTSAVMEDRIMAVVLQTEALNASTERQIELQVLELSLAGATVDQLERYALALRLLQEAKDKTPAPEDPKSDPAGQSIDAFLDERLNAYQGYYSMLTEMSRIYSAQEMAQAMRRKDVQLYLAGETFGMMSDMMQNLTVISGKEGGAAFKAMKAFAIAETTIQTYRAAMGAYAALAPIPIVGPALATAAAAAATIAGMAKVRQIAAMEPGGSASGSTISAGGTANPSYSGGSYDAYPAPQRYDEKPPQAITIQIYNPLASQNWKEIVEDNIIPALNDAADRNISVTVRNM